MSGGAVGGAFPGSLGSSVTSALVKIYVKSVCRSNGATQEGDVVELDEIEVLVVVEYMAGVNRSVSVVISVSIVSIETTLV
jgi:hypothetical protein